MDGHQYEYQCAKMLRRKGFSKVHVTKGSGDQGIDVIAYSSGKKYGIQCKYYTSPVGNHAVQEAFAGAKYYNCDVAVVMTNNTFTQSAKDLAHKTNVLLWDRNKIPLGINSFWLTKFIGIFVCIVGLLGLITMWGDDSVKLPILQAIGLIVLILGGLCAIFEYRNWGASFISCTSYLFAAIINLIFSIASMKLPSYDFLIFIGIAAISFLRMDYLHKVTNGYHVWKNGFKQFVYDNFSKKESKSQNRNEGQINVKREELKETNVELSEALKDYGNIYVNIFNEHFYIHSVLVDCKLIKNDNMEFIIKCDTLEQAEYVVKREDELNHNLQSTHKMTLLANNCISLIVLRNKD